MNKGTLRGAPAAVIDDGGSFLLEAGYGPEALTRNPAPVETAALTQLTYTPNSRHSDRVEPEHQ